MKRVMIQAVLPTLRDEELPSATLRTFTSVPICIGEVLDLVGNAIDKIFPDQTKRHELKARIQSKIIQHAIEEKSLLFGDLKSARDVYIEELRTANVPKFARLLQVLARPFTTYAMVMMYLWVKLAPILASMCQLMTGRGVTLPSLELGQSDYWLIGSVFIFLFGARSFEKLKGKD